jgi:hypothetical protein
MRAAAGFLKATRMNGTECDYAAHLRARQAAGEVLWHAFEPVKLRLAEATFYAPDFLVMIKDGSLECHEVKGFWRDDARVKIKVAASLFPFRFIAAQRAKGGAGWIFEEF